MAESVTCPKCFEVIPLTPARRADGVTCPVCGTVVTKPPPEPDVPATKPKSSRIKGRTGQIAPDLERGGSYEEDDTGDQLLFADVGDIFPIKAIILTVAGIAGVLGMTFWLARQAGKPDDPPAAPRGAGANPNPGPARPNNPNPGPAPPLHPPRPFEAPGDPGLTITPLTKLAPFGYQPGPWGLGIGVRGEDGKSPLFFERVEYKHGISMHPPQAGQGVCRVSFKVDKRFKWLRGWAGIGDYPSKPMGSVVFGVSGDGRKLWESEAVGRHGAAVEYDIDVTGVEVLTLETWLHDGSYGFVHGLWLDPVLGP